MTSLRWGSNNARTTAAPRRRFLGHTPSGFGHNGRVDTPMRVDVRVGLMTDRLTAEDHRSRWLRALAALDREIHRDIYEDLKDE